MAFILSVLLIRHVDKEVFSSAVGLYLNPFYIRKAFSIFFRLNLIIQGLEGPRVSLWMTADDPGMIWALCCVPPLAITGGRSAKTLSSLRSALCVISPTVFVPCDDPAVHPSSGPTV